MRVTPVGGGRVLLLTGLHDAAPDTVTSARVTTSGVPSVAAIAGHCTGQAFELALACDLRFAADTATFSAATIVDVPACARRLARLLGEARAKDVLLTGRSFDAGEALRLGVVTRVVSAARVEREALAAAEAIAAHPPPAVRAARQAIERVRDLDPAAALAEEHDQCARLIQSRGHRAAVAARGEHRPPMFTGD